MLITDKNEIIRLKLIYGSFNDKFISFAERYTTKPVNKMKISIFALIEIKNGWKILLLEQNGKSVKNKLVFNGENDYVLTVWHKTVNDKKPNWFVNYIT